MNAEFLKQLEILNARGWSINQAAEARLLPKAIVSRYPWATPKLLRCALALESAVRGDERVWLLTADDYNNKSDSAYAWNEWELQSLEAAEGDGEWTAAIRRYWDEHLPIAMSVADGYAYYAVRSDGSIVTGCEPEFEESELFAGNYEEFLQKLSQQ